MKSKHAAHSIQESPDGDTQNRTVTGQTNGGDSASRHSKTHQDYWKDRLKTRSYVGRDGSRIVIPEWQVRLFYRGREAWFNLNTASRAAAAIKARDIYVVLISSGWEATLAKFKPDPFTTADVCTVGEFLADVLARGGLKAATVRSYAVKLRKIVSDVAKVDAGARGKQKRMKFDYRGGGLAAWRSKVDGQKLDILTPESITSWRNQYTAKAGTDPIRRKSAERSAASCIRCARALFSPEVLSSLKVKHPPNPFAGVKLKDPGPQRYHSDGNLRLVLTCAETELREGEPEQYKALFLIFWAGLRRKEADLLLWEQVDFQQRLIHIRRTAYFEPKTEESARTIDLSDVAIDRLREFKKGATSEFVLVGGEPNIRATYAYYRCDHTWRGLNAWLKKKGVRQTKAIHAMRKESGSIIASDLGIEAARQHLGHRSIRTTSDHYVDKKKRIEVSFSDGALAVVA